MNTCLMLRNSWGWGGMGWDVLTFVAHEHMFDATQQLGLGWDVLTFVAHEHMFDATQQLGLGWGGMGCVNIRCTWTHVWCYATVGVLAGMLTFLVLAHMVNATQLLRFLLGCSGSLHLHTCSLLLQNGFTSEGTEEAKQIQMKILKNVPNVWWNRHFYFKIAVLPYPQCTSTKLW